MRKLKIGLLGCGTVGSGFVRLLSEHRALIRTRAEADFSITRILVRDLDKERAYVDHSILTSNPEDVVANGADVVVELLGGDVPARSLIRDSLVAGKHVVTANKSVLSRGGADLLGLAAAHRVHLGFEASVCGAIPIVRILRQALAGDRVRRIEGVVNGTCNFILSGMEDGVELSDALRSAQELGFAEADASLDLNGEDAAQKIAILSQLAFGDVESCWIRREGIDDITLERIEKARRDGRVLRLVASAVEKGGVVELEVSVRELLPEHPLARIRGVQNGLIIESDAAGTLTFCGAGAGSLPSAASVLADVMEIARRG